MAILLIHGGAGKIAERSQADYEAGLRDALDEGYAALERAAVRLWRQGCTGLEIESLLGLGKGSASRMLRRRRVRVCRSEALRRAWRNGRRQQGRAA